MLKWYFSKLFKSYMFGMYLKCFFYRLLNKKMKELFSIMDEHSYIDV